ncbi:MAG: hypothetical protein GEU73_01025 [Chloroflexi bacterium]|nr:hypothetical protein [Chloroflexota bacterium]
MTWGAARAGEIRRLAFDCLDAYRDGTPRLHIPAGKTRQERVIPLNKEAAAAIWFLQAAWGWPREVERHRCTVARLEQLLAELGQPLGEVNQVHEADERVKLTAGLSVAD